VFCKSKIVLSFSLIVPGQNPILDAFEMSKETSDGLGAAMGTSCCLQGFIKV
jgi:hypothetical protein